MTDKDGNFFDFDDDTVKALGSCTTPSQAMTENSDTGGANLSEYVDELTLSSINNTGEIKDFFISIYEQAGGSPNLATDEVISPPALLKVQFGREAPDKQIKFSIATKTTAGTTVQAAVWMECNGEKLDLSTIDGSATCQIEIKQHGSEMVAVTLLTTDFTLNADDVFQAEVSDVSLTADNLFTAIVTISENGNSHSIEDSFYLFP